MTNVGSKGTSIYLFLFLNTFILVNDAIFGSRDKKKHILTLKQFTILLWKEITYKAYTTIKSNIY